MPNWTGVHLETLSRLFEVAPPAELKEWLRSERTGQYARRAGFFYEINCLPNK